MQLFKHDPRVVLDFWAWVNKHVKVGVPFMRGYYNLPMPYRKWVTSPQPSPFSQHKIIMFVNTILKVHLTYTNPIHSKLLHYLLEHTNFKHPHIQMNVDYNNYLINTSNFLQHMISRQSSCTMQIHHHGRFVDFLTTHDNCPPLNMLVVLSWLHLQCNIQIIPSHATNHVTCDFVDMSLL